MAARTAKKRSSGFKKETSAKTNSLTVDMTPKGSQNLKALVDAYVAAVVANAEIEGEPDVAKRARRMVRKPATAQQIADLERAWGRSLPPTYRAFLDVCNGIDDSLATHRLLGTTDQAWAKKQVALMTEYWDEDDYDAEAVIPVAVPDGDCGIRNFAAFARGSGRDMPIIDWDTGSENERFDSFASYLRDLIELQERVAKSTAREKRAEKAKAKAVDRGRTALVTGDEAIPTSGARRKAIFEAIFELDDIDVIGRAVEKLVRAKPTKAELGNYITNLDRDLASKGEAAFARAELLFHPKLQERASWAKAMNDAIARAFGSDKKRSERWADVARPHVGENAYLGHNLACAFVAVGRIGDAFEMCKAAVAADYPRLSDMRTDRDLGPLLKQPRFQALFGPADRVDGRVRTTIPRNAALEADVARGKSLAKYGAWLDKQGSALGAVVLADLAASKSPHAKRGARATFARYQTEVLAKAFPSIAKHMTHYFTGEYYLSFRYGILDALDTFPLNTAKERQEALALLSDPHGMFVRHVCLRKAKLDSFDLFKSLSALRRIECRWTDITQVRSLEPLAGLEELRSLDISNSGVHDLRPIAKSPLLQLDCSKTKVVDLSPLARHPTLSYLTLSHTSVRDLSPLLSCPKLCRVELWGVKVERSALDKLIAHIERSKNKPLNDDALTCGYDRGVSHPDA